MGTHGKAYLIGAGPGDPRLLTLRGAEALGESDVVFVDALVHEDTLRHAKNARIVPVGKRCGRQGPTQEAITRMLVEAARNGAIAARLKGGDPFVFGRGGEEALALAQAGLPFEIVPGVTAAAGAAAHAGIPLTHRGLSSRVSFVAARGADMDARGGETVVFYMCQRTLVRSARDLLEEGWSPSTPAAIVRAATLPSQEVYLGCLDQIVRLADDWHDALDPTLPTLAIVGDVAMLGHEIGSSHMAPRSIDVLAASPSFLPRGNGSETRG
jgi:uroporphyrin-III C-methyltransferase